MKYFADLHIHSRFSRATSRSLNLANLEKYAKIKGVNLLGTGDFMHPEWQKELKQELKDDSSGVYRTKTGFPFILSNEISLMYRQDNQGRRVHLVLLAPSFEVVDQITDYFKKFGRVDYDGRPIFGKSAIEVTEALKKISDDIEIIPAHIWTPYFGMLGSKSGFNSVKEAFGDQTKNIYSFETGLSSDPEMNWRVSELDKYTILSFSDAHSFWPWRLGREATIFDLKNLTYKDLIRAIRTRAGYVGTIEFWPHEGKYHYDGHRACNVCMSPSESIKHDNICPACRRPLTIGVAHRVEELADRPAGFKPKDALSYKTLIPLSEVIAGVLKTGVSTNKVWQDYNKLIKQYGSEFKVLLDAPRDDLSKTVSEKLADMIIKNRNQEIKIRAGFDGQYGTPVFNNEHTIKPKSYTQKQKQLGLDSFA